MSRADGIEPRHARQARLAEIGAIGQHRIAAAQPKISLVGLAGVVAARYLAGAGVGSIEVAEVAAAEAAREVDARVSVRVVPRAPDVAAGFEDLDPSAREVARGAHAALSALRAATLDAHGTGIGRLLAVLLAVSFVALYARSARADIRELAAVVAERHRSAGAEVSVLGSRFVFEGEAFSLVLPQSQIDADCTSVELIGARGLGFHVTLGEAASAKVASAAGALEIAVCDRSAAWSRLRVHVDAGRGALEIVVSRSFKSLPSLLETLPERSPATVAARGESGPAPPLPPLPARVEAASLRARIDGARSEVKVAREASADGAGEVDLFVDAGCHRFDVLGAESLGRRRARTDIDAELRDVRDDVLLARDRGDAPDARLESCFGVRTPVSLKFVGAAPREPVIVSHAAWPAVAALPREWSAVTRARASAVLHFHHISQVDPPALVVVGGGGATPVPVALEPGACYAALVVVSQGASRGLRLFARLGASQWSEERPADEGAALVSFCAAHHGSAQLDVEARGSSLAWTLALLRVTTATWAR